jgi:hypothetical protein
MSLRLNQTNRAQRVIGKITKKSGRGNSHGVISEVSKNEPEFQVGMLAMKTEAGRTTNHASSST